LATFAENQLVAVEALLAENPGATSVTVDGQAISFDNLLLRREHWRREVARETGRRPIVASVKLGGVG
jgi:hypothetical protein